MYQRSGQDHLSRSHDPTRLNKSLSQFLGDAKSSIEIQWLAYMFPAMVPDLRYDFWIVHCPKIHHYAVIPTDLGILRWNAFDLVEEIIFESYLCHGWYVSRSIPSIIRHVDCKIEILLRGRMPIGLSGSTLIGIKFETVRN